MIWRHAIGNRKIHIINKYRRLGHAVMDDEYWRQHHAERPGLRASSYMYTYGTLPTTKQLADNNLCDLLVTCLRIYQEAIGLLYSTNTFAVWDLRTVVAFKHGIPTANWQNIRSVEIYAMFHRRDDIDHAVENCSVLQLEAWPSACTALASLPHLRELKILIGKPSHLDAGCLAGKRIDVPNKVLRFVAECRLRVKLDVCLPAVVSKRQRSRQCWKLEAMTDAEAKRLEARLRVRSIDCTLFCGLRELMEHTLLAK
jgi:hypothetical protein